MCDYEFFSTYYFSHNFEYKIIITLKKFYNFCLSSSELLFLFSSVIIGL